ncbi:MAG: 3'-5' exonuclease [Bacteroidaceae bacterium]|jgi:DNA polymerase-3 subunit epsilon|nr:3'-5' exonuclease [Bacteroidaceae bacterium]
MKLNLKRPLVFFDLETTGVNLMKDRIVEISCIKIMPNGDEERKVRRIRPTEAYFDSTTQMMQERTMHIPEASTAIHGITDEDVKDCPTFRQLAKGLADYIKGCDLAGFNSNKFDIPMLAEEFYRVGIDIDLSKRNFVDVQNIYHKLERRTLVAAYKFYCGGDLENDGVTLENGEKVVAHSALADTIATYEVLKAQLDKYPDELQNDIEKLADFSKMNDNVDLAGRFVYNENKVPTVNFGKYKGESVFNVFAKDPAYYDWMQRGDFPQETKHVLTRLLLEFKEAQKTK